MSQNYDSYRPAKLLLPDDGKVVEAIGDTGSIYPLIKRGDAWFFAEPGERQCWTPIVYWRYAAESERQKWIELVKAHGELMERAISESWNEARTFRELLNLLESSGLKTP